MDKVTFLAKSGVAGPLFTIYCHEKTRIPQRRYQNLEGNSKLSLEIFSPPSVQSPALKQRLAGKHFGTDEELENAVVNWFNSQTANFFAERLKKNGAAL